MSEDETMNDRMRGLTEALLTRNGSQTSTVATKIQRSLTITDIQTMLETKQRLEDETYSNCPVARVMEEAGMSPKDGYVMVFPRSQVPAWVVHQIPKYVRVDTSDLLQHPVILPDPDKILSPNVEMPNQFVLWQTMEVK